VNDGGSASANATDERRATSDDEQPDGPGRQDERMDTTTTAASIAVDDSDEIAKLATLIDAWEHDADPDALNHFMCVVCNATCHCDYDLDPTPLCNLCAQDLVRKFARSLVRARENAPVPRQQATSSRSPKVVLTNVGGYDPTKGKYGNFDPTLALTGDYVIKLASGRYFRSLHEESGTTLPNASRFTTPTEADRLVKASPGMMFHGAVLVVIQAERYESENTSRVDPPMPTPSSIDPRKCQAIQKVGSRERRPKAGKR